MHPAAAHLDERVNPRLDLARTAGAAEIADHRDAVAPNADVHAACWSARAVQHVTAANDQVEVAHDLRER